MLAERQVIAPSAGRFFRDRIAEPRPNYSPLEDLFVAEVAGDVVGYLSVVLELGIQRALFDCWVRPQSRKGGVASRLFTRAGSRAKRAGARVAHVYVPEDDAVARHVLLRFGFQRARRFLELTFALCALDAAAVSHGRGQLRTLRRGEEPTLTELQNRAFAETWGFNPNTNEEVAFCLAQEEGWGPEDVILGCDQDRPVAYCWTAPSPTGTREAGDRRARIHMLGVDPAYRGRGMGKQVLLAGLSHLRGRGIDVVELTVDGENPAAGGLYESVGFKLAARTLWYEKSLS